MSVIITPPRETNNPTYLYPPIEPYNTGKLKVSAIHEIYYEESGNPKGKPVLYLHGGPGAGSDGNQRRFFNPDKYRIVLMDQRGCGKSTPHACLDDNTTWHLVADLEALRQHLKIDRWQVFGGSWGSTLALAYAQSHPEQVTELVLRGIFLVRPQELSWFYQYGTSMLFPEAWEKYLAPIPEPERGSLIKAYYARLTAADPSIRIEAARAWSTWEGSTVRLLPDQSFVDGFASEEFALAFSRIECHYFINKAFFPTDNYLIENIGKIRHIPAVIVHGRYDVVCPADSAWQLHKAWPEAELFLVPDAGHSAHEPGIQQALVMATDRFVENI